MAAENWEDYGLSGGWSGVYREIVPALIRQRRDPAWFVRRSLPEGVAAVMAPVATAAE